MSYFDSNAPAEAYPELIHFQDVRTVNNSVRNMSYFDSLAPAGAYPELVPSQDERTVILSVPTDGRNRTQKPASKGHTQVVIPGEPFPRGYAYLNEPTLASVWTWEWVWDANRWVSMPVQVPSMGFHMKSYAVCPSSTSIEDISRITEQKAWIYPHCGNTLCPTDPWVWGWMWQAASWSWVPRPIWISP